MKTTRHLFVDQPVETDPKLDLFQFADQVEREGWIDTSCQLAMALCLAGSLVICGLRVAAPVTNPPQGESALTQPATPALVVGALEAKVAPTL